MLVWLAALPEATWGKRKPENLPTRQGIQQALRRGTPASCAKPKIYPGRGGHGWHKVQYQLERVYCGLPPDGMYRGLLRPGARQVTENHYAGALFTALYADGEAARVRRWLADQLAEGHQGGEQAGGYTNFYRADVLAGLRWAVDHGDRELERVARRWLEQSYALDLLHTAPGSFEVAVPAARHKRSNLDGREVTLSLLAGATDPREVLLTDRWRYPAYNDVRWLADAILAGRFEAWPWAADWAVRRDVAALGKLRAILEPMRLRSSLVWVLLDNGGWYSYAPQGIGASSPPTTDAVSATVAGEVTRLGWTRRSSGEPEVAVSPGRLAVRRGAEEQAIPLPRGRPTIRLAIGAGR
jgi:hypothetical protein